MAIFKNSRYTKTHLHNVDGNLVFLTRQRFRFPMSNATPYLFTESDRLDNLARTFYGDPQLHWVILEANPQYRAEFDIKYGDILMIPALEEVMKCLT